MSYRVRIEYHDAAECIEDFATREAAERFLDAMVEKHSGVIRVAECLEVELTRNG